MRTVTLSELRNKVLFRADIEYDSSRHSNTRVNAEINNAIVNLRGALTRDQCKLYLSSATGTIAASAADANANYSTITAPATAQSIWRIDIIENNVIQELEPRSFEERLDSEAVIGVSWTPNAWTWLDFEARTIAIYPVPQSATTYVLWYETQHTTLTADSDTFTVLPGFEDYIIWCTVEVIAVRDDLEPLKRDARLGMERSYAEALRSARAAQRGFGRRRDTRRAREHRSVDPITRWRAQ